MKKWVKRIHLWLGLLSGLILFIVAITGCCIVFEQEINTALGTGVYRKVEPQDKKTVLPSQIFPVADSAFRHLKLLNMNYSIHPNAPNVSVLWARDTARKYHSLLQNPYTGTVAGTYDYYSSFFTIMTHIHTSLALGDIGTTIIRYATLIFVLMMISGLILWKPASKKGYKQRFTIKWGASFKRLNYDLHNVLGFYMTWIAVFIAFTGLIWSFEWFRDSAVWIANGGKTLEVAEKKILSFKPDSAISLPASASYAILDSTFLNANRLAPDAKAITVYKPANDSAAIRISIETNKGANYARTDEYFFHQYTGALLTTKRFSDLTNGEKMLHMNYYIHVGSIGGITGKILAFFASLIAGSLPVTGFLVWRGRKRKRLS